MQPADAGDLDDPEKLRQAVAAHVSDIEGVAATANGGGLKVDAFVVPDALAYRIAKEYLKRRDDGANHGIAVQGTATALKDLKRLEGLVEVFVKIESLEASPTPFARGGASRRIFTFEGNFEKTALALSNGAGKAIRLRFAKPPANLRAAQLRVQKFWKVSEKRSVRRYPGAPSSGWEPVIGKPIPAFVIEGKPVEAELLFKVREQKDMPKSLKVSGFKRYEGTFQDDILDLNYGRTWDPIPAIDAALQPPPAGLQIPPAVARLVREVRAFGKKP